MDYKVFFTVFTTVFLAELGDKTQVATLLFAANKDVSIYTVFLGSALALVLAAAIGVLAGSVLSQYLNEKLIHSIAGVAFIFIGIMTLYRA